MRHAYLARKVKKRNFRRQWIQNINASTTEFGIKYHQFMNGLVLSRCELNRKMLAELAKNEPLSMRSIIALSTHARKALVLSQREIKDETKFPYIKVLPGVSREDEEEFENSNQKKIMDTLKEIYQEQIIREREEDEIYEKKLEQELKKLGKKRELVPGD